MGLKNPIFAAAFATQLFSPRTEFQRNHFRQSMSAPMVLLKELYWASQKRAGNAAKALCCICICISAQVEANSGVSTLVETSVPADRSATFSPTGQIWDAGLLAGAVRTEYSVDVGTLVSPLNLVYNQGGAEGCLWDSSVSFAGCPGRSGLAGSVWAGTLQGRSACGGDATISGQSWVGCKEYAGGTYFSQNSPNVNYWMIHANDDPSFDQCNEGPPGASHPIAIASSGAASLYKIDLTTPIGAIPKTARIQLNLGQKNWFCAQRGTQQFSIPFISVGAQNSRGNPGPVGTINLTGSPNGTIVFNASVPSYSTPACAPGTSGICNEPVLGIHLGIYGVASWGGKRRLIVLDLFSEGSQDTSVGGPYVGRWNWPIGDSEFYPGAEIIALTAGSQLSTACGMNVPLLPLDGTLHHYNIDFGKLINCANQRNLFSQVPPTTSFNLDGAHWFIEGVGTAGNLELNIKNIETAIFVSGFE